MNPHQLLTFVAFLLITTSDVSLSAKTSTCEYDGIGASCGPKFVRKKPNSTEIETILKWHNDIRQRAASGSETQTIGTLDSASNMMKMYWDPELEALAQRLADQCIFQHDKRECRKVEGERFTVGQNIARAYFYGSSSDSIDWENLLNTWYKDEVLIFRKSLVDNYLFGDWGHYSQVIWWNTRSIGCGASIYVRSKLTFHHVVCNYGATGNYNGVKMYSKGKPCSNCPSLTSCDSDYDALCAPNNAETFVVTDEMPSDSVILW